MQLLKSNLSSSCHTPLVESTPRFIRYDVIIAREKHLISLLFYIKEWLK